MTNLCRSYVHIGVWEDNFKLLGISFKIAVLNEQTSEYELVFDQPWKLVSGSLAYCMDEALAFSSLVVIEKKIMKQILKMQRYQQQINVNSSDRYQIPQRITPV